MTNSPQLVASLCVVWGMVAGFQSIFNQSLLAIRLNRPLKYLLPQNICNVVMDNNSFIHLMPLYLGSFRVTVAGSNPSILRWGRGTPWRTHQFIAGPTQRDRQPFTCTFIPAISLEQSINLNWCLWTVWWNRKNPNTGRTCKMWKCSIEYVSPETLCCLSWILKGHCLHQLDQPQISGWCMQVLFIRESVVRHIHQNSNRISSNIL